MPPSGLLQPRRASARLSFASAVAAVQALGVLAGLWAALHYIQEHLDTQPLVILLFPLLAIGGIMLVIPLFMFISFQDDFAALNPGNPVHFLRIARRCYAALAANNLKVAEKDL